jgi:hypothetical protein
MTISTRDFCIWLRQFLGTGAPHALTRAETAAIRQRLSEVFIHEIDPAMGDAAHRTMLDRIHRGGSAH